MTWKKLILALLGAAAGGVVALLLRARDGSADHRTAERAVPGYVANPATAVFHRIDCRAARNLSGTPLFTSAEDAILEGYRPCGLCRP